MSELIRSEKGTDTKVNCGRHPGLKSKFLEVLVLGSLFLAGCNADIDSHAGKNTPENVNSMPTTSEQYLGNAEANTPTNTQEPTLTPTITPTPTPESTATPTRIPTFEFWRDRGYVLEENTFCGPEKDCTILSLLDSTFEDYEINGDEMILHTKVILEGKEIDITFKTEKFRFSKVSGVNITRPVEYTSNSNLSILFDPASVYQLRVIVIGFEQNITPELVEDYINGYLDLKFDLWEVIQRSK